MSEPADPKLRDDTPTDAAPAPSSQPTEAAAGTAGDSAIHRGDTRPANRPPSPRDRFEDEMIRRRTASDEDLAEEQLWTGGYSPRAMVGWWVTLTLLTIGLIVATIMFEPVTWLIALAIVLVMWSIAGLNYARMRLGFQYELTSQRFIHRTGILSRRSDRIEVIDIDDVSYQQGPVQRIFGVGTIHITSSDRSDPELYLLGIDKVSEVAGLIDDVRRTERRRRSLHIESI